MSWRLRGAEGFHQGEVAAALEDAGGERCEHADGYGEGDQEHGSVHEGVGAVDDAGLAGDEGADWFDVQRGESALEGGDGGVDAVFAAGDLDFEDGGLDACPGGEGGAWGCRCGSLRRRRCESCPAPCRVSGLPA